MGHPRGSQVASHPQEETLRPSDLRAAFPVTEVKRGSKAGKGALPLESAWLIQPRAKTQRLPVSPNSSPPHFFSKSNKFWLVITYAPPHSSKSAFVQENRELFSWPYQCPRKGEKRSGWLSAPAWGQWDAESGLQGWGVASADPAECLQGAGKEVGGVGRGSAQPTENIIAPGVGCCKQEGCGQDLSAAAILLMPPIPTAFDQQANGILCPEINAWSEGVGGYGRG